MTILCTDLTPTCWLSPSVWWGRNS